MRETEVAMSRHFGVQRAAYRRIEKTLLRLAYERVCTDPGGHGPWLATFDAVTRGHRVSTWAIHPRSLRSPGLILPPTPMVAFVPVGLSKGDIYRLLRVKAAMAIAQVARG